MLCYSFFLCFCTKLYTISRSLGKRVSIIQQTIFFCHVHALASYLYRANVSLNIMQYALRTCKVRMALYYKNFRDFQILFSFLLRVLYVEFAKYRKQIFRSIRELVLILYPTPFTCHILALAAFFFLHISATL